MYLCFLVHEPGSVVLLPTWDRGVTQAAYFASGFLWPLRGAYLELGHGNGRDQRRFVRGVKSGRKSEKLLAAIARSFCADLAELLNHYLIRALGFRGRIPVSANER